YMLLRRALSHQLVERSAGLLWPQHAPQPLDVLAPCAVATDDDGHAAVGDVHTLVEHTPSCQLGIAATMEAFEYHSALLGRRLVRDLRDAELAADLVDHHIVFAEDEHTLPGMLCEDLFE